MAVLHYANYVATQGRQFYETAKLGLPIFALKIVVEFEKVI